MSRPEMNFVSVSSIATIDGKSPITRTWYLTYGLTKKFGFSHEVREINDNRQEQGKELIPLSSFYRFVNSQKESLTRDAPRELQGLIIYG
jgi:hypothetical protein